MVVLDTNLRLTLSLLINSTLQLNREWVKKNVTQRRGLAIPDNFQQTSPAHDPIRTMGYQEKYDNCRSIYGLH